MLDTVVMSGDDVCCSVVFGTLVGVFVFSVMWSELLMTEPVKQFCCAHDLTVWAIGVKIHDLEDSINSCLKEIPRS